MVNQDKMTKLRQSKENIIWNLEDTEKTFRLKWSNNLKGQARQNTVFPLDASHTENVASLCKEGCKMARPCSSVA